MFGPGAFRLLLALIVVAHHTTPLRLGAWAVYVFFILSGYWIARMWDEKYQRTRAPSFTFLISRWWRLAPVLFTTLAITIGGSRLQHWPLPPLSAGWALRQLPIIGSTFGLRLLPPQWSIDVEMQFYVAVSLLFPFLAGWHRRYQNPVVILAGALAACGGTVAHVARGGSPDLPLLWPVIGLFILGVWLWHSGWEPSKHLVTLGGAVFVGVSVSLIAWPETRSALVFAGGDVVAPRFAHWPALWQVAGSLLMVPFLARNVKLSSPPLDRLLGNWAYPLYLFHWLPREWYYRHVDWTLGMGHNAGLLVLNVTAALAGSFVILLLIDRPFDRLRARWVNNRVIHSDSKNMNISKTKELPLHCRGTLKQTTPWTGR